MKSILHILIAFLALTTFSCTNQADTKSPRSTEYTGARFFSWANYSKNRDWDKFFKEFTDVGFDGLIISGSAENLETLIPIADKYGVEIHAWMWTMNNGGIARANPEYLEVNQLGHSLKDSMAYVGYYQFLCPAIDSVRIKIAQNVEKLAKVKGLKSISLDYCRYVDAILPTTLWKNYRITQERVYPKWDYGYNPEMIKQFENKFGYNPQKQIDPTMDQEWLNFRCDVLNKFVDSLATIAHKYGKKLSASPFPTPKMSKAMVYQDWGKWNLDMAFPMMYHGFYNGDIKWIEQAVVDSRRDMQPHTDLFYGMIASDFNHKNAIDITKALQTAFDNGALGFSVYRFDHFTPEVKATLKEFLAKQKKN